MSITFFVKTKHFKPERARRKEYYFKNQYINDKLKKKPHQGLKKITKPNQYSTEPLCSLLTQASRAVREGTYL